MFIMTKEKTKIYISYNDNNGNRIGYGHGFYDKYLTKNESTKIALTYSKQIVKSIPNSEHDIKMDWIVTETDVIKIS